MSKLRSNPVPLFEGIHGKAFVLKNKLCRECGTPVTGRRTRWCSDACVEKYEIRRNPAYCRKLIRKRDKRVCAMCKLDTNLPQKARSAIVRKIGQKAVRLAIRNDRKCVIDSDSQGVVIQIQQALAPWNFQAWWKRKSFWDLEHIIPVADGGGECDLSNYQTLCIACHAKKTEEWRRKRAVQ